MATSTPFQSTCLLLFGLVAASIISSVSSSTEKDQKNFYLPPFNPGFGSPPIDPGVGSPPIVPIVGSPPIDPGVVSPPIVETPPVVLSPPIVPSPPIGYNTSPPPTYSTPPVHHTPPSSHGGGHHHHHGGNPPKNCGNPTPHSPPTNCGSPPTNCGNPTPSSPPRHVDPSPPHHNPSPAPPTYHYSPPPSGGGCGGGCGGGGSPPTDPSLSPPPVVLPPITPGTPFLPSPPYDPNSPPIGGTCDFWRNHPGIIWGLFGWWGTTVGSAFGVPATPGTGTHLNLLQALSNTRTDGIGALYREGTASLLNSMVNKNFPYTTSHVKDSFVAAVVSNKAAAAQARVFKLANEGHMKLRV